MFKDELLLKCGFENVFFEIFSFVPLNHYGHRSSDCKPSILLAEDSHQPDKASGPLITHKEKRKQKESLSRGNSIALVLFLFFLSLFLAFPIFCFFAFFFLFQKIRMFPL